MTEENKSMKDIAYENFLVNQANIDKFNGFKCSTKLKIIEQILDYYISGEKRNKLLLFLLMLGNMSPEHKSFVIYRGDPGGGKNVVSNGVLKLFPEEKIYVLDGTTAKALNYDEAINSAEIVYLRELENHETVIEILKGLYNADGRIFKETIRDSKTGEHTVKHHEIGRKGVLTTFSFENIASDIISRSWVLNPDQSYGQTARIINFYIDKENDNISSFSSEDNIITMTNLVKQTILALDFDFEVHIPYVKFLKEILPVVKLNVRRDILKILSLIKIITIWNQKNRKLFKIKDKRFLFSEYEDFKTALEICQDLFVNQVLQLDNIKKLILDFLKDGKNKKLVKHDPAADKKLMNLLGFADELNINKEITKREEEEQIYEFHTTTDIYNDIVQKENVSRKTIQRKLDDLYYEGYIDKEKDKNKNVYRLAREYDLIKRLKIHELKDEIDAIVDQRYMFYKDKTPELMEGEINGVPRLDN